MNCPKCNELISEGAKFCNNCGFSIATEVTCPYCGNDNKAGTKFCEECGKSIMSQYHNQNNLQHPNAESETAKKRLYRGKGGRLPSAANTVLQVFRSEGLDIQKFENPGEIILQGRKPPAWYKKVLGLDIAASVKLHAEGDDLITEIGGATWMDKAAGVGIGLFVFWPTLLTTGWGAYMQNTLFKKIDDALKTHLEY
ncbi:MAG: zinc ribbon domain-containing protein [Candidatus Cloacimonadaceae bacterium]|nr:zinc ribbon domain-containing protein [Candidatus Cloacimonadaceae bacterium]